MDGYQQYIAARHYVYSYRDYDGNIVYVGHGCDSRAWFCGAMTGDTKERQEWKKEQLRGGRLPCDWVVIEERNLTKEEASNLETKMIKGAQPILNRLHTNHYNPSFKKWTDEHTEVARELRDQGYSYKKIAENLDVTTMTVWRNLNG